MKHLLKTTLSFFTILFGIAIAHAEQVTLAAWDFSNDVKYTQTSADGNKTYYTASSEAKQNVEYNFSTQQPFFYPTSGVITTGTLTLWSSDGSKKWFISNYNNGALRMYTASPHVITDPTDAAQHYNYAEVELSAAGYKNLQFSCRMSGNNSKTLPVYVMVSTDGGTTWMPSSTLNNTGSSWSNFNESKAALAVDNQASVKIRTVIGYDAGATGDMYMNSFKVTGETLGGEAVYALTTSCSPADAGYVAMSPVGDAAVGGTEISYTAKNLSGYKIKEWQDANGNILATAPTYTTTINGPTAVTAVFGTVETYTLTVNKAGDGAQWGEVTLQPASVDGKYDAGTEVTLTVVPNMVTNFLTWEDNSTELSRVVTVNGNTEVTATFDVIPFIVAWDFNNDKNTERGNRPADYAFTTENTGVMMFYQGPNCSSTSWGSGRASFGGKELWAARRYTDWSKSEQIPRAFVASFSVRDYDKIKIHSLVAANNSCVRQRQLLQLSTTSSTDGFTTLKTLTLEENPNSDWVSFDYELDTKDIDGMVYVRWIEDETSDFFDGGNHSGTEGFYLADVIILADQNAVDDKDAPQLVSSSPADGSTGASARGNIVLSFDERVKAGTGCVPLNGETLTGSFGSKSVTYAYHGLSYGQQYTLSIGEDAIVDLSGNVFPARDITFTVMERPMPTAKLYDAVVAADGTGNYTSVQAAINAAPSGRIAPWLIFVKNGQYEELVTIPKNKPFIHLIGQDKEKTIIKFWINNGSTSDKGWEYSVNNPASKAYGYQGVFQCDATDFYTENITYYNSFGVERQTGPQAQAMRSCNDRQTFYNCKFRSYQDTWFTSTANSTDRHYVKDCYIEGAVDYFYGGGDIYVENSEFCNVRSGSVIVAPAHKPGTKWGYVMQNCRISAILDGIGKQHALGRPWHESPIAVWLNTTMLTTISPSGWNNMGTIPALFAEYNSMDSNGNPVDLNQRRTKYQYTSNGQTITGTCKAVLTAEEAARYTYEAVTTGTDDWNPRRMMEAVDAPSDLKYSAADCTLTWSPSEYAICYVVIDQNDQVVGFTKDSSFTTDGQGSRYSVKAVNEYGSLSQSSTVSTTTDISTIDNGQLSMNNGQWTYYNLQGVRLNTPARGLNIVSIKTDDGRIITKKIIN